MARPRALRGDERCKEQICIEANRLENAARAVRDMATEEKLDPTRSCNVGGYFQDKPIRMTMHSITSKVGDVKILFFSAQTILGDDERAETGFRLKQLQ